MSVQGDQTFHGMSECGVSCLFVFVLCVQSDHMLVVGLLFGAMHHPQSSMLPQRTGWLVLVSLFHLKWLQTFIYTVAKDVHSPVASAAFPFVTTTGPEPP